MAVIQQEEIAVEPVRVEGKAENHQARLILVFSVAAIFLSLLTMFVIRG